MSFAREQARFSRLHREHAAWQLLRSDNAAHTLAFVADLFSEQTEIPFTRARAALEAELEISRETGTWETEVAAQVYLRQWIQAGWLREFDDLLCKTDACEVALRFAASLDQRESHATASHLRIVQDAARDLALALSADVNERVAGLESQKARLQQQIDDLNAGIVEELDERTATEQARELYQLAAVLTGDFRRVEDEIRELDQSVRVRMIESDNRGEVLGNLMDQESLLAESESGRAFQGFFDLLMDQNRGTELREQLRQILASPAAQKLNLAQRRYLGQLMRELSRESERVFAVRRRTEESLRSFIERGVLAENKVVDSLLSRLEQLAIVLREEPQQQTLQLSLNSGTATLRSVSSWQLHDPGAKLDGTDVVEHDNKKSVSTSVLDNLQSVRVMEVAAAIRQQLTESGPATISQLIPACSKQQGLEELVAFVRVAVATDSVRLPEQEEVELVDRDGTRLRASVPGYLLDANTFPESLEELAL